MAKDQKTNVMRKLDGMKIQYQEHYYTDTGAVNGVEVARVLGENADRVFKTLVTVGKSGNHYVYLVPVSAELDLSGRKSSFYDKIQGIVRADRLCTRRLFTDRNEKVFPYNH